MFLEHHGFTNVINLAGGVAGWASQVDPKMPHY
jgi:rhodanese-related sulfurtransferase